MSIDYGYGCVTCGVDGDGRLRKTEIITNCREPEKLAAWLDPIDMLKAGEHRSAPASEEP